MWCPEGFVTLDEITTQFLWDSDLIDTAEDSLDGDAVKAGVENRQNSLVLEGYLNWMHLALFSVRRDKFRVCLASGATVRLAPSLFVWFGGDEGQTLYASERSPFPDSFRDRVKLSDISFECIDTRFGRIRVDLPSWMEHVKPLSGCPLCIFEGDLPVPLEALSAWLLFEHPKTLTKATRSTGAHETRATGQRIVEAFERGTVTTRPEARDLFGRGMKHAEWEAHWKEACKLMPSLSKPGPRRR